MLKVVRAERKPMVGYMLGNGKTLVEELDSNRKSDLKFRDDDVGFILFDRIVVHLMENDTLVKIYGEIENESGIYFLGGDIYNPGQVEAIFPKETEIIKRLHYIQENIDENIRAIRVNEKFFILREKDRIYDPEKELARPTGQAKKKRGKGGKGRNATRHQP